MTDDELVKILRISDEASCGYAADRIESLSSDRDRLRAENEAMKAVVEAARKFKDAFPVLRRDWPLDKPMISGSGIKLVEGDLISLHDSLSALDAAGKEEA